MQCNTPRLRSPIRAAHPTRQRVAPDSCPARLPKEDLSDQEKTKSPIFQPERRFVNLSHLSVEKKELPEGMCDPVN
jgi:hypothetical protein